MMEKEHNSYKDYRSSRNIFHHYLRSVDAVEQLQYLLHNTRSLSGAAEGNALWRECSAV